VPPGEAWTTIVVRMDDDREVTVARIDGRRADLALIDALARLQLALGRLGYEMRLRDPGDDLRQLIALVGLAGVLGGPSGLPLEARRQAEGGEQVGTEEVVDPADPSV
jgi:hypothetical protein